MIACLDNLIGILNIQEYTTSESGLWINDLNGITTQQLDLIKDDIEDYDDPGNAWEKIYTRAKHQFEKDIIRRMRKYLTTLSIIDNVITSQVFENVNVDSSGKRGYFFDFPLSGNNLEINFQFVQVYLPSEQSFTVELYNAIDGKLLETASFTGTGTGLKKLSLGWTKAVHEYPKLFICLDHAGKTFKQVDQYNYGRWPYAKERITTGSAVESNLSVGEISMILSYQIQCSVSNFVCQRRHLFEYAFLYCLGIEFKKELLGSDEVNQYTLLNREDNEAILNQYKQDYDEALDNALQGLEPQEDGICFTCNKLVTMRYMHP